MRLRPRDNAWKCIKVGIWIQHKSALTTSIPAFVHYHIQVILEIRKKCTLSHFSCSFVMFAGWYVLVLKARKAGYIFMCDYISQKLALRIGKSKANFEIMVQTVAN